jgi:hypothetical protein
LVANPTKLAEPLLAKRKKIAWAIDVEALSPTLGFLAGVALSNYGIELWRWLVVLTGGIPPTDVTVSRVDDEKVAITPVAVTETDA